MPNLEFWFSGTAIFGAAGFLFTAILAAISIKPLNGILFRWAIWILPFVVAGIWYTLAKSEAEKAKPERDYAYFDVSDDPRDSNGEVINLVSKATGPLKDVSVAIQTADERKKRSRSYIFSQLLPGISEGGTLLSLALAIGDYWIDSDPPTKLGKVLEHLLIEKKGNKLVATIDVIRKETQEVLIPPPETISFSGGVVLSLICLSFMSFAFALGWASRTTT